ncbi:MAG: SO_0444 family Cu/Zn efflux transporter [Deltaproteobacteria bacterium]|nr:SO_0444 family Cu/Zn efflux transporter [Candidatus Zymogenaceae bacterium]
MDMWYIILEILGEIWWILTESAPFVLFGTFLAGLLYIFLNPEIIYRRLSGNTFGSVFAASLFGIPLPLCSCGVLPVVVSLSKQGANRGAVLSFLISTPESGVDSIAVTYALMDPLMTIMRPLAAFVSAITAGILGVVSGGPETQEAPARPDITCRVDACCSGVDCPADLHKNHHSFWEKMWAAIKYAFGELFEDFAPWFVIGIVAAGILTSLTPAGFLERYLGGGVLTMLIMLAMGIPVYICATASTPLAAALVLSGVSPGAALVFLLAGPATNVASLSVVAGNLGRRAVVIYVTTISVVAVVMGLFTDYLYTTLGVTPRAYAGDSAEFIPEAVKGVLAAAMIILLAVGIYRKLVSKRSSCDDTCSPDSACKIDTAHPHGH